MSNLEDASVFVSFSNSGVGRSEGMSIKRNDIIVNSYHHHRGRGLQDEEDDADEDNDNSNNDNNTNNDEEETETTSSPTNNNSDTSDFEINVEGYLTLGFSLYLPRFENDWSLLADENNRNVQEQLDSLLLYFLCSRGNIDVVASPDPGSLVSVCPFDDSTDRRRKTRRLAEMLQGVANQFRQRILQSDNVFAIDEMVLWNVPKVDKEVLALYGEEDVYYTQWNFTYPVHQWGETEDGESSVQSLLDRSILSGTFDALLTWNESRVSIVGQEMQTFGNGTFYDDDDYSDTGTTDTAIPSVGKYDNIPQTAAKVLKGLGTVMIVLNAIVVVLLTILARRHRIRKEELRKEVEKATEDAEGLGTEEGVTSMLLESKQFALEKTQALRVAERRRNGSSNQRRASGTTSQSKSRSHPSSSTTTSPKDVYHRKTSKEKGSSRIVPPKAAPEYKQYGSSPVYNDRLLPSNSADDEDEEEIVKISHPPSV
jgi:hypothetical protein